jgi:hypothetical protein
LEQDLTDCWRDAEARVAIEKVLARAEARADSAAAAAALAGANAEIAYQKQLRGSWLQRQITWLAPMVGFAAGAALK